MTAYAEGPIGPGTSKTKPFHTHLFPQSAALPAKYEIKRKFPFKGSLSHAVQYVSRRAKIAAADYSFNRTLRMSVEKKDKRLYNFLSPKMWKRKYM